MVEVKQPRGRKV